MRLSVEAGRNLDLSALQEIDVAYPPSPDQSLLSRSTGDVNDQQQWVAAPPAPAAPAPTVFDPAMFGLPPGMQLPPQIQQAMMQQQQMMPGMQQGQPPAGLCVCVCVCAGGRGGGLGKFPPYLFRRHRIPPSLQRLGLTKVASAGVALEEGHTKYNVCSDS